jgi:hypothetical protein
VSDDQYEWPWLYAAVEPMTGQSFCLLLRRLEGACFGVYLQEWRQAFPAETMAMMLGNSGAHTSHRVTWPPGIAPVPCRPIVQNSTLGNVGSWSGVRHSRTRYMTT